MAELEYKVSPGMRYALLSTGRWLASLLVDKEMHLSEDQQSPYRSFFFFFKVELIYSDVLFTAGQQSDLFVY